MTAHRRCSFTLSPTACARSKYRCNLITTQVSNALFVLFSSRFTLSLAWQYPRPPLHAASLDTPPSQFSPIGRPRHTSMSSQSPYMPQATINVPQSFIPPSLTPGGQRARIWDKGATQRPRTSHAAMPEPYHSPQRSSLYGDYFFAHPQAPLPLPPPPPLPQKPQALLKPLSSSLPPIPPKPPALAIAPASRIPLYPTSIPLHLVGPSSQPSEPIASETVSLFDEKGVELARKLSASLEAQTREQELIAKEEEELARALEESRLLTSTVYTLDEQSPSSSSSLKPPAVDRISTSAIKTSAHPPEGESWLHLITPTPSTSSPYSAVDEDSPSSHSSVNQTGSNDDPSDLPRGTTNDVQSLYTPRDNFSPTPPLYANVVSNLVRSPGSTSSTSRSTVAPSSPSTASSTYPQSDYTVSSDRAPTSPSLSLAQSSSSEQLPKPLFTPRPSWSSVSSENSISVGHSLGGEVPLASTGYKSPTHPSASPDLSCAVSANLDSLDERVEEEADTERGPSTRVVVPLTANHYVEREMLLGICELDSKVHLAPLLTPLFSFGLQSSGHLDGVSAYGWFNAKRDHCSLWKSAYFPFPGSQLAKVAQTDG